MWQWWTKVLNARCHTLAWQIVIMTRWHEDDLVGRLTDRSNPCYSEKVARQWTVINIPAIVDNPKIAKALGLKVGSALWPERFSLTHLETAREMNPNGFEALYMGRPAPPEGSYFKQAHLVGYSSLDEFPKNGRHYLSGDLGVPNKRLIGKRKYDKSCIGLWALDEHGDLWLHPDLIWDVITSDEVVERLLMHAKTYNVLTFFAEKGQIDNAIGPFLEKRMQEEKIYFHLETFPSVTSKGTRAIAIRSRMAQGKVRFPTFAPWWPAFKEVLLKFTGSGDDAEDDPADMLGLIGQGLMQILSGDKKNDGPANVVRPKAGTVAYFRWIRRYEEEERKRRRQLAGW